MDEHNAQRLLVAWFRDRYPHLAPVFFAIPNGGKRGKVTAAQLRDEGVLPGIPDLLLCVPNAGGAHGLFLELKTARGSVSAAQRAAHSALEAQGYTVAVARGYEAAKAAITEYLSHA